MHTMASDDTEITLGVGKLLGLFFLLAAICGVFFSIGYSLGRTSGREQAANDQPSQVNAATDTVLADSTTSASKPSAAVAVKPAAESQGADDAGAADQQKLTFYKAVQQNDNPAESKTESAKTAATSTEHKVPATAETAATPATESTPASKKQATADVISHTSPVTGPGTLVVQIAAVSREDDAVALAGALRKKNYNVFVVNNPVTNDKFYHVQVGPFSSLAEAQAMKAKLAAEGYNTIIKR